MQKIRVAIAGAGFAAETHADGYSRFPLAEMVAVSSLSEERARDFARRWCIPHFTTHWQDLIERRDVDLLSVCVPTNMHRDLTVAAAEAGKHVICEKPLTTSLAKADEMIQATRGNKVRLFYAENWLFAPAMQRIAHLVRNDAIGKVLYYRGRECSGTTHSRYSRQKDYAGGGTLMHMSVHPLGFGLALKENVAVSSVYAALSGGGPANLVHKDFDGEDFAIALVSFEDGTWCLVEADFITKGGLDDEVEIFGSLGTIKANFSQSSPIRVFSEKGYDYAVEKAETTMGWSFPMPEERRSQGWIDEIEHFLTCIRDDLPSRYGSDAMGGRRVLEVALAGYESARQGRRITIPFKG